MDLKQINIDDISVLKLKHPATDEVLTDDAGNEMTITLYGVHSNEYRKLMFDLRRKAAVSGDYSFDDSEGIAIEILVNMTVDWNIQLNGKHPRFSKKTAANLYKDKIWIKQQVDAFIYDRRNFLSDASAN